jgi:hypothetical protein
MDTVGHVLAVILSVAVGAAEGYAVWRWGVRGTMQRLSDVLRRIVEGPPPRASLQAEIARLERELEEKP